MNLSDYKYTNFPFRDKLAAKEFKKLLRPGGATFWTVIGVGASAIAGSIAAIVIEHKNRICEHPYELPEKIHSIEIGNGIEVNISFNEETCILIKGKKKDLKCLSIDTKGGCLRMHLVPAKKMRTSNIIKVSMSLPSLDAIALSGNSVVTFDGINKTKSFTLKQCNGRLSDLTLESEQAILILTGNFTSDIAVTKGDINAEIIGNGEANITLSSQQSSIRLGSEAKCIISGHIEDLLCHMAGESQLDASELTTTQSSFKMNDLSAAQLYKTEKITVSLTDKARLVVNNAVRKQGKVEIYDSAELVYDSADKNSSSDISKS